MNQFVTYGSSQLRSSFLCGGINRSAVLVAAFLQNFTNAAICVSTCPPASIVRIISGVELRERTSHSIACRRYNLATFPLEHFESGNWFRSSFILIHLLAPKLVISRAF